jgi:tRNA threonylcarbamoyl adenosine modification protein (Sua5/YciO/YrdC/YwlC family)
MGTERRFFEDAAVQKEAVKILRRGGVVIIPTDTLYGLSATLTSDAGYKRILDIKECDGDRNFLLLASSIDMVDRFICSWGCASKEQLADIWPAPLTGIFPSGSNCPSWAGESIAFRVPDYDPVRRVIEKVGEPILSTSVNAKGNSPLHRYDVIEEQFGSSVDLIAECQITRQDLPSTIVDFSRSKPHLVRQGSYPW